MKYIIELTKVVKADRRYSTWQGWEFPVGTRFVVDCITDEGATYIERIGYPGMIGPESPRRSVVFGAGKRVEPKGVEEIFATHKDDRVRNFLVEAVDEYARVEPSLIYELVRAAERILAEDDEEMKKKAVQS